MAQASATKKTKPKAPQVLTTARGGHVRLTFGCILIGLGLGWALALVMNTAPAWMSMRLLRDTANGLGGVMCGVLPILVLWGGALLCMSARHKVAVRMYLLAWGIFLCAEAVATLVTSIGTRENTLMNYIANCNRSVRGLTNNTTYGAYLSGAYYLRAFNGGMLAGGGLLGMLLAYPLQSIFGVRGAVVLLIGLAGIMVLIIPRVNYAEMIRKAMSERDKRRKAVKEESPEEEAQPVPEQQMSMEHPARRHKPDPVIQPQTVNYTNETTYVPNEIEESYLVKDEAPAARSRSRRGFVPVETGVLYEEHIPVGDQVQQSAPEEAPPKRTRRAARQESAPQAPVQPAKEPEYVPVAAPAAEPEEDMPWYENEIPPVQEEAFTPEPEVKQSAPQPVASAPKASLRGGKHVSGEVKQVFTDPAVPLTGERIPIQSQRYDGPSEDPLAAKHTAAPLVRFEGDYKVPPLYLLKDPPPRETHSEAEDHARAEILERTLKNFNIEAKVVRVLHGPTITRFALQLAAGVNVNKLGSVANNLALELCTPGVLYEIPIPGTNFVGVEVPNEKKRLVTLKEVLASDAMRANPSPTLAALGLDIAGTPILCELSEMPHLLVAGATKSGKSVCINAIVLSLIYRATPQQVRLIMIDPKVVELQPYNGIPHLITPVITDPRRAAASLDWLVQEMERRYHFMEKQRVRNMEGYNAKMRNEEDKMPAIVTIIDEFSDLMLQCKKDIEISIQRLAAKARAAGIYLIVATQRPSVDVITGVIKANIPSRIAFAVANTADSQTILNAPGADKLLGRGDMLYCPITEAKAARVQGCYVSDDEVEKITDYLREHNEPNYDGSVDSHIEQRMAEQDREKEASQRGKAQEDDFEYQTDTENEMLQRAIEMAVESGHMSISLLRRRFGIGHSKAGMLVDTMADMGIISGDEGPKSRRTLITREDYARMQGEIADQ